MLDWDYVSIDYLRPFKQEAAGEDGRREEEHADREYGLRVKNEKAEGGWPSISPRPEESVMADVRDRRFFDHDPLLGHTEYFHYDPETDGFAIEDGRGRRAIDRSQQVLCTTTPRSGGASGRTSRPCPPSSSRSSSTRDHERSRQGRRPRPLQANGSMTETIAHSAPGPAMSERPRVMIATPCTDSVKAGFALDLARCTARCGSSVARRSAIVQNRGTIIPQQRATLVDAAQSSTRRTSSGSTPTCAFRKTRSFGCSRT
jgi:hypothetical protein